MNVTLAKSAGFCPGVKRAVDIVYDQADRHSPVYTYGPIIHNDEVVGELQKKGVRAINSLDEMDEVEPGIMIIRSHGVTWEEEETIRKKGFEVVDATCPFVKKIHRLVREHEEAGEQIVIIGDENHPEVRGIMGWCHNRCIVLDHEETAKNLKLDSTKKVCIVSQTTFNYKKFKEIVEILDKKGYDILALNTICNATEERQTESRELAKHSDAMIVIGGRHSSNTQKLYEICKKECENTYYIQTLVDLDLEKFKSFRNVGITAGASTPNKIIKEVELASV